MVTSFGVIPGLPSEASASPIASHCGPGEDILDLARSEGKTILHFNVSSITGTTITIPEDEVWVAHDNLTLDAELSVDIKGSLVGVQPTKDAAWGSSLEVDAETLSLSGNLSAGSGANVSTVDEYVRNESGNETRVFDGVNATSGGEIVLDVTSLSAASDACLATGDGGDGADVITWGADLSSATEARVEHLAGNGDRGGNVYTYEDLEDEVNATTLYVGNGGAGGRVVANHSFAPEVGNQTIVGVSGAGGLSGIPYTYDRSSTDLDLEGPDIYTTQSAKIDGPTTNDIGDIDTENATYLEHVNGSGNGGPGGDGLLPLGTDYVSVSGLCSQFPVVCENGTPPTSCASYGVDGTDGTQELDGDGQDGTAGHDGNPGDDDIQVAGVGGSGISNGGDGGDAFADGECGGNGGRGGDGGDATEAGEQGSNQDGGNGAPGGWGGDGGRAEAYGGDGGDAAILTIGLGEGGDGGYAKAYGGDGGVGGRSGHGGDAGCGDDAYGGKGNNDAGVGGNGRNAAAEGGNGGDGETGGDGGDAGAEGGDGEDTGISGDGGDGGIAGQGGNQQTTSSSKGYEEFSTPGSGGDGTVEDGSAGSVYDWAGDGIDGEPGSEGTDGTSC